MRIRRAIGATSLSLAVVAALAGCADDPKDKAFGGGGDLPKAPSTLPTLPMPSLDPSLRPDATGGSSGLSSGGSSGGLSSGGSSGGYSSGGSSGGTGGYSAPPTYNPNANGEVVGGICKYDRNSSRMTYEVDIQNASNEQSFRYSYSVVFKVGTSASSTIATRTIATRPNSVTVNAGGKRSVNAYTTYTNNERFVYSCQILSPRKYLSR
ncbi:hypothetical protein MTQ01_17310 [Streptomyces sp. XM4193]|uniref:hypothetical protein n=1 Tax=Streptomyces sp. XM4193 TaxID=2929782 RepID=UPI001FFB2CD4|nr:hypothetical protein [Streptomyces sp. XM4193]MCK1797754.1 hypothetical protein [Streptomyces sp. XM4193]